MGESGNPSPCMQFSLCIQSWVCLVTVSKVYVFMHGQGVITHFVLEMEMIRQFQLARQSKQGYS